MNIIQTNEGSSVIIVSDYRLEGWVQFSAEAKDFSSILCVQTSSEVHPASFPLGTDHGYRGFLSRG